MSMNPINRRFKWALENKKITADELGKAIGVSRATVSQWRSGGHNIMALYVEAICKKLEISMIWLLTGTGDMNGKTAYSDYCTKQERHILGLYRRQDDLIRTSLQNILEKLDV